MVRETGVPSYLGFKGCFREELADLNSRVRLCPSPEQEVGSGLLHDSTIYWACNSSEPNSPLL